MVHTTQKHPFLTIEKGFLPVGQIKLSMHVLRADGSVGTITGWKLVPGSATMYNLEVAQDHTYTVGDGLWIVHNCAQDTFKGWIKHDTYNQVRDQFGKKGVQRFVNAMQKGFVGPDGVNGVKNLGKDFLKKWGYQYEVKVVGGPEGDYRIYGNFDPDTGFHIFDYFSRHLSD